MYFPNIEVDLHGSGDAFFFREPGGSSSGGHWTPSPMRLDPITSPGGGFSGDMWSEAAQGYQNNYTGFEQ